jgi:hypothetical protein
MLYENTVAPATLGLLKELMQMEVLKPFALVGGTNLSLRLGHRISEDLDIFAIEAYESEAIILYLRCCVFSQINTTLWILVLSSGLWSILKKRTAP